MGEDSGSIFHLNFTVANKLTQEKGALSFLFLTGILSELLKALLIVCADYFRILRNDFIILKRMAIVNCLNPAFILSNVRKGPNFDTNDRKKIKTEVKQKTKSNIIFIFSLKMKC